MSVYISISIKWKYEYIYMGVYIECVIVGVYGRSMSILYMCR